MPSAKFQLSKFLRSRVAIFYDILTWNNHTSLSTKLFLADVWLRKVIGDVTTRNVVLIILIFVKKQLMSGPKD